MQTTPYFQCLILAMLVSLVFATAADARDKPFDRIVVFGTSLSDPGNAFALFSDPERFGILDCDLTPVNVPPYDMLDEFLVPVGNYGGGGHHTSNGETWVEALARDLGVGGNAGPALKDQGIVASNYATASARARDMQTDPRDPFLPCLFNLSNQVALYMDDFPEGTLPDTLIIIEMGGNDARDALVATLLGLDGERVIQDAIGKIETAIRDLVAHGATKFLVLNVPPVEATPAVQLLAAELSKSFGVEPELILSVASDVTTVFNAVLPSRLADLQEVDLQIFDFHSMANNILEAPSNVYGLENTTASCVTPDVTPFVCKNPDAYFFWDGTHPTKAVHAITAEKVAAFLAKVPQ